MLNLVAYLHLFMLEIGPWLYKILTFILMFASGLVLNNILKRHASVAAEARFFIVLLFLVLPFNIARVALIDFPYTLCYFLFFLAWLLMDRFRVAALLLFFLSFNTNSLLVFYALPILDMIYRDEKWLDFRSLLKIIVCKVDYIVLPFIFFAIKVYFFSPSGQYNGYNEGYKLINLITSPAFQALDLFGLQMSVGLIILFSGSVYFILKNKSLSLLNSRKNTCFFAVLGLLCFVFGAFPYWIVGCVPTFIEWSSRHQLLLPFGTALIIVGVLSFSHQSSRMGVMSIVVGASLAYNVSAYSSLFVDWQKQKELINLFSKNTDIKNARLIVVSDNSLNLNALRREYRFYEWNGLMKKAFGNELRFCIPNGALNQYYSGGFDKFYVNAYKAGEFRKESKMPAIFVEIKVNKFESLKEKIINRIFPELSLSVTEIDQTRLPGNKITTHKL